MYEHWCSLCRELWRTARKRLSLTTVKLTSGTLICLDAIQSIYSSFLTPTSLFIPSLLLLITQSAKSGVISFLYAMYKPNVKVPYDLLNLFKIS